MPLDIPAFMYAAVVAGGGVMGYVKSNSVPSLVAGLICGSLLGFGAYQISQDRTNILVYLCTSAGLGVVMGSRYLNSRKMMPAGAIAILSAFMASRAIVRYISATYSRIER